jgi:hypothetical protein
MELRSFSRPARRRSIAGPRPPMSVAKAGTFWPLLNVGSTSSRRGRPTPLGSDMPRRYLPRIKRLRSRNHRLTTLPAACATTVGPPRPIRRAIPPASIRRCFSSRWPNMNSKNPPRPSESISTAQSYDSASRHARIVDARSLIRVGANRYGTVLTRRDPARRSSPDWRQRLPKQLFPLRIDDHRCRWRRRSPHPAELNRAMLEVGRR